MFLLNLNDFNSSPSLLDQKFAQQKWATTTWAIWNARNRAYFDKVQTQPQAILDGSIDLLNAYHTLSATQENSWYGHMGSTGYMGVHASLWYKEHVIWDKCAHFPFTLYTNDTTINKIFLSVISTKKKKKWQFNKLFL